MPNMVVAPGYLGLMRKRVFAPPSQQGKQYNCHIPALGGKGSERAWLYLISEWNHLEDLQQTISEMKWFGVFSLN